MNHATDKNTPAGSGSHRDNPARFPASGSIPKPARAAQSGASNQVRPQSPTQAAAP